MGRKKEYNRAEVLEKAMELFWHKGYEGTHLQELVEVTGLNRFGLYKEFGGKAGLFDEAMDLYLGQLSNTAKPLSREPRGMGNILAYYDELKMDLFLHGCFLANSLTEKHVIDKKTYDKMIRAITEFQKVLKDNIVAAKEAGNLKPGVHPDSLIKFLTVFDLGMVVYEINAAPGDKDQIITHIKSYLTSLIKPV